MNIEKGKFRNITRGSNGRKILIIFIIWGVFDCFNCYAIAGKYCMNYFGATSDSCFTYIAKKIGVHNYQYAESFARKTVIGGKKISIKGRLFIQGINDGRFLKLKSNNYKIEEWNDQIDWPSMKYSAVSTSRNVYLIAKAKIAGVSGLGSNFSSYLIVNLSNGKFYILKSIAEEASFFYVKNDALEFYLFDYSKDFFLNRDYNNISFNQLKYRIEDEKIISLGSRVVKCPKTN